MKNVTVENFEGDRIVGANFKYVHVNTDNCADATVSRADADDSAVTIEISEYDAWFKEDLKELIAVLQAVEAVL